MRIRINSIDVIDKRNNTLLSNFSNLEWSSSIFSEFLISFFSKNYTSPFHYESCILYQIYDKIIFGFQTHFQKQTMKPY